MLYGRNLTQGSMVAIKKINRLVNVTRPLLLEIARVICGFYQSINQSVTDCSCSSLSLHFRFFSSGFSFVMLLQELSCDVCQRFYQHVNQCYFSASSTSWLRIETLGLIKLSSSVSCLYVYALCYHGTVKRTNGLRMQARCISPISSQLIGVMHVEVQYPTILFEKLFSF